MDDCPLVVVQRLAPELRTGSVSGPRFAFGRYTRSAPSAEPITGAYLRRLMVSKASGCIEALCLGVGFEVVLWQYFCFC